jgi:regulation of enolase protein 1 (concanavalin A-like superfamily)
MPTSKMSSALGQTLGFQGAADLSELMDSQHKEWSTHVIDMATNRFERRLSEEISTLKLQIRDSLHDGLTAVRAELATTRFELLKWSFVFWVGQVVAIVVILTFRGR